PFAGAAPLFALAAHRNVYLKFTSMNIHEAAEGKSTPQALLGALLDRFGADRMMWGSDFAHTTGSAAEPSKDLVDLVRGAVAFLSTTDREQVLAGTARTLFPALVR